MSQSLPVSARRVLLLGSAAAMALSITPAQASSAALPLPPAKQDVLQPPPAQRVYASPAAAFELVLSSPSQAQPAQAELFAVAGGTRRPLWRQALPHVPGPRTALVSDGGEVVLLDEWSNLPSRHALLLLDAQGRRRAHYNFDELVGVLAQPRTAVAQHAVFGAWLAELPRWSADGHRLLLPAAGRTLVLQLADGRLSVH